MLVIWTLFGHKAIQTRKISYSKRGRNCPTYFCSQFSFVRLDSVFSISWKIETRIRRHWILFNFSPGRISKIRPISSQRHCFSLYGWRSCFSPGWKARGENEFSPSERSDLAILITGSRISPVDVSCYSCHFHRYRAVAQPSLLTVRSRSTFASYIFLFKLHGEEPYHVLFSFDDEIIKIAIPNCVIQIPISHGLVIFLQLDTQKIEYKYCENKFIEIFCVAKEPSILCKYLHSNSEIE